MEKKYDIDGFDVFLEFFGYCESKPETKEQAIINAVRHIVNKSYFFSKKQVDDAINNFNKLDKKPVRKSEKNSGVRYFENDQEVTCRIPSNKKERVKFSEEHNIYVSKESDIEVNSLSIIFDYDNNTEVRDAITKASGHIVSKNKNRNTINYYTIAHIWDKTYHPLYFCHLWNVCLMPTYAYNITDKADGVHELVNELNNTLKAICYKKYELDKLRFENGRINREKGQLIVDNKEITDKFLNIADDLIKNCVKELPQKLP